MISPFMENGNFPVSIFNMFKARTQAHTHFNINTMKESYSSGVVYFTRPKKKPIAQTDKM